MGRACLQPDQFLDRLIRLPGGARFEVLAQEDQEAGTDCDDFVRAMLDLVISL